MDQSAVIRIIEAHLERIRDALRLHDWCITVEYGPCDDPNWAASCNRAGGDYNRATITIAPHKHDTEEDVLRSLTHELLHIALAPLDVYRDAITALIPQELDDGAAVMEQRVWTHALERTVTLLERGVARHLWEADPEPLEGAALTD